MRLRSLFAVGALTLTLGAMAGVAAFTVSLPTQTWVTALQGDVTINATEIVTWTQLPDVNVNDFGNTCATILTTFQIDTRYVDILFKDSSSVAHLGSTVANGTTFALIGGGWAKAQTAGQAAGGSITRTGNILNVVFGVGAPGDPGIASPKTNLLKNGNNSAIQFVVKTNAIAADFANAKYTIGRVGDNFITSNGTTRYNAANTGGVFQATKVVPEPSAIIALVTGLGSLLALRRKA